VPALLLAMYTGLLWHAIPIILIVSLVYGATRHELLEPILHHAVRTAVWITGFMLVIAAVLAVVSWFV
jgi:heme/copper-type cytochrome/quinol oxidase subunit 2